MVGSGFSLNGKKLNSLGPDMPLWWDVKKAIFDRMYPGGSEKKFNQVAANSNRLAQEYELEYGAGDLNELLASLVPDHNYEPGLVHDALFSLKWADILTTNYDTLLERAAEQKSKQEFSVVRQQDELAYKVSPRIIKLHGSLPNSFPLIITEEHFRTYAHQNSAFVNTAQQIMIENSLVLVGFSGDDPNFLSWSGWVRDNLGDNRRNIYLVGVFNLSKTQARILESRRIFPIDYSDFYSDESDINVHESALLEFFNHLKIHQPIKHHNWPASKAIILESGEDERPFHWKDAKSFFDSRLFPIGNREFDAELLEDTFGIGLSAMKELHELYPNWAVCPLDNAKEFSKNLESLTFYYRMYWEALSPLLAFELAYEILYFSVHLHLLYRDQSTWSEAFEIFFRLIQQIDPFPGELVTIQGFQNTVSKIYDKKNQPEWNWVEISDKWMFIAFYSLMAPERYQLLMRTLKPIAMLKPIWTDQWYFQKINGLRLELKWIEAIKLLNEWDKIDSALDFQAKKGLFFFDLGINGKANTIFQDILNTVKSLLRAQPGNLFLLSLEGLALRFREYSLPLGDRFAITQDEREEQGERLRDLKRLGADSWANAWEMLEEAKTQPLTETNPFPKKRKFDFGHFSIPNQSRVQLSPEWEIVSSYLSLFIFEGYPIMSFSGSDEMINWLANFHYGTAMIVLEKVNDEKAIEKFLDAGRVWVMGEEVAKDAMERNLSFVENFEKKDMFLIGFASVNSSRFDSQYRQSFLVVARLFSRFGVEYFKRIFELTIKVVGSADKTSQGWMKDPLKTIIAQLSLLAISSNPCRSFFKWAILMDPALYYQTFDVRRLKYMNGPWDNFIQYQGSTKFKDFLTPQEKTLVANSYVRFYLFQCETREMKIDALSRINFIHEHWGLEMDDKETVSKSIASFLASDEKEPPQNYSPSLLALHENLIDHSLICEYQGRIKSKWMQIWAKPITQSPVRRMETILTDDFPYRSFHYNLNWSAVEFRSILERVEAWLSNSMVPVSEKQQIGSNSEKHILIYLQSRLALVASYQQLEEDFGLSQVIERFQEIGARTIPLRFIYAIRTKDQSQIDKIEEELRESLVSGEYYAGFASIKTILLWAKIAKEETEFPPVPKSLLAELINSIRYRFTPTLNEAVKAAGILIWKHSEAFDNNHRSLLLSALNGLLAEFSKPKHDYQFEQKLMRSEYQGKGNEFDELRINSAQLALASFKLFPDGVPDELNQWKMAGQEDSSVFVRYSWISNQFWYDYNFYI